MDRSSTDDVRFRTMYAVHLDAIVSYCMRRTGRDDAMDAVQDTFAVAWRRIDEVPTGEAERSWLYAVAFRVLSNQRRSTNRFGALKAKLAGTAEQVSRDPAIQVVRNENDQRLIDAVASLRKQDQEILRLIAWEEHPRDQVAAMFGISRSTLDQRIHRAIGRLRKAYDPTDSVQSSSKAAEGEV